jgi:chromosome segregation ATPase
MTTTTTMTATERTAKTVETKKARLEATKDRVNNRIVAATLGRQKAEKAIQVAQERLEKAKAKLEQTKADGEALVAKQTDELSAAKAKHADAVRREQEKQTRTTTKRQTKPAGTVEAQDGKVHALSASTVATLKEVLGRRRKGVLTTKSGDEGKVIDAIAKDIEPDLLGDVFQVQLRGRTSTILFAIEKGEVTFETESK